MHRSTTATHRLHRTLAPLMCVFISAATAPAPALADDASMTPNAAAITPKPIPVEPAPVASEPMPPVVLAPRILQERDDRVIAVLPNRMVLVAQRLPAAPVVSAQVFVKTGSLYEQEHVGAGLSHYLEHLLSGGSTSTRPERESTATLGRIGAQINAATSLDNVFYYINTTAPHTFEAIDLLSDWMRHNTIDQAEYDRERDVIQAEFSMGQGDPGRIHWKLTQQARYNATPDHPGSHPTIGYVDEFMEITREELLAFYKRMYVPNNMVFVVAGDIDPRATLDHMVSRWIDAEARELPVVKMPAEPASIPAVVIEGAAGVQRLRSRLLWPGVVLSSEHDYALDLLTGILGQGESSRLTRTLRDERSLVSSISAFNYSASWGRGFVGIDFEPAQDVTLEAVVAAIEVELEKARTELVSDAELARAKRRTISSVVSSGQTAENVAGMLARDILSSSDPDYRTRYIRAIESLTAEDLRNAAGAVMPTGGASRITLRPVQPDEKITQIERPGGTDVVVDDSDWVPFELDNARLIKSLEANLAATADTRVVSLSEPATQTLSNGLTVIVQRSTVVPAVSMQLYTLGGLLADNVGKEGVHSAAFSMLTRGAGNRDAQQLAAAIEDLGAAIGATCGTNTAFIEASALSGDWQTVMGLMSDVVLRPRFDPAEWAKMQPRIVAAIARSRDRWNSELSAEFRARWFAGHVWSQTPLGRADVVEALTAEDLRAAYSEHQQASRSVLTVVGDVEASAVFAEAERLFGTMSAGSAEVTPPVLPAPPSDLVAFVTTSKPVTAVSMGFGPGITRDHPDYAALSVFNSLISDFPGGWLQQALRGDGPGLVYVASGGNVTGRLPGFYSVVFNTRPEQAVEATKRALDVVRRGVAEPASPADLERAKAKVLTNEFTALQSNSAIAADLALNRLYNVGSASGAGLLDQVQSLSAIEVRDAAARYFSKPPLIVVLTSEPVNEWGIKSLLLPSDAVGD